MTAKKLLAIDFREIKALEITCSECGAMLSIPLPKDNITGILNCPGCNRRLWNQTDDEFIRTLSLIRSLSNWQALPTKVMSLGFSLTQEG